MFIGVIIRLVMGFINNRKQNQDGQDQGGNPVQQPQGFVERPAMGRRARRRLR